MLKIFAVMLCAAFIGWLLKNRSIPRKTLSLSVEIVILVLMLMIGMEIGANPDIFDRLANIIVSVVIITAGAVVGTIALAWAVNRLLLKTKCDSKNSSHSKTNNRFSLLILIVFIIGVGVGYSKLLPAQSVHYSMWALYILMALVGFSLGSDAATLNSLKHQSWKVVLLPVITIVGTMIGVVAVSTMVQIPLGDQMAVGAGFGYYSLSSVIISEIKGAELGAIALLVNVARELVTVMAAPIIAKKYSPAALICCGGATTIDITLPVIIKNCGQKYSPMAIFHGVVVDMSVPILVTLLISIS